MEPAIEQHGEPGNNDISDGSVKCPKCNKELIAKDLRKATGDNGKVLKSRLVFFQADGTILGKCGRCGNIVGLPYTISEAKKKAGSEPEKSDSLPVIAQDATSSVNEDDNNQSRSHSGPSSS